MPLFHGNELSNRPIVFLFSSVGIIEKKRKKVVVKIEQKDTEYGTTLSETNEKTTMIYTGDILLQPWHKTDLSLSLQPEVTSKVLLKLTELVKEDQTHEKDHCNSRSEQYV